MPKPKSVRALLICVVLLALGLTLRSKPQGDAAPDSGSNSGSDTSSEPGKVPGSVRGEMSSLKAKPLAARASQPTTASQPTPKSSANFANAAKTEPRPSLIEIFRTDDICALERFVSQKQTDKNHRTFQAEAQDTYFSKSAFKYQFDDYSIAVSGMPGAATKHGRFLSALRMANWIEDGAKFEGLIDVPRAIRDLKELAFQDAGNAAPAAFAYALSKGADPSLATLIRSADRFDSYQLGYLQEMADLDDPRAVSLLVRVSHHANLAIPNWAAFRTEFTAATENENELRYIVTDLMIQNSKNAKKPSYELGYNVLEAATARNIAGAGRAYPNFKEIDAAFSDASRRSSKEFIDKLSEVATSGCDPKSVTAIKDYVRDLNASRRGLGLAL